MPKAISYEELAEVTLEAAKTKSLHITGGDIRKLTLMFCTQLTSGRYSAISKDVAETVIGKYLEDLQETGFKKKLNEEIPEKDLPETVKNELNK